VNPTLNFLETGLLTVDSKLPFNHVPTSPRNPIYLELPHNWNHSPSIHNTPFPLLRITPFSSFQPPPCHTPKGDGRRTLDRRKASAIILKSDRCTPDRPNSNRVQLRHYPEQYLHGKPTITRQLSRMSVQVPRAIHVPTCQSVPIKYAVFDRRSYQLAHDSSALSRRNARTKTFRRLHLTLAGRGLQSLSCLYRCLGSTPISRITRTSL
jgi:hypothetical protein